MSKKRKWELRHDMLAPRIWAKLPEQDRKLREIQRSLAQRQRDYAEGTGSLLGEPELEAWRVYRPQLAELDNVSEEALRFFDESEAALKAEKEAAEREREEKLAKERRLRGEAETAQQQAENNARQARRRTRIAVVLAVLAGIALIFAVLKSIEVNEQAEIANNEREKALNLSDSLQITGKELASNILELEQKEKELQQSLQDAKEARDTAEERRIQAELAEAEAERKRLEAQAARDDLETYAKEAMPVLLGDIENLILYLQYDTALARCQTAWKLNPEPLRLIRAFQEIAYFFTETGALDKAEATLAYIGQAPEKGSGRQEALRAAVKEIDFSYWRDSLETRYYPEMVEVEGGTFDMGCDEDKLKQVFGEDENCPGEEKKHTVSLKSFKIARTETTVWQYALYCAAKERNFFQDKEYTPSWGWQGNHPVVNISWYDALAYAEWLTEQQTQRGEKLESVYKRLGEIPVKEDPNYLDTLEINWNEVAEWDANGYRLLTEAEWEYAARGGQKGKLNQHIFAGASSLDSLRDYAVFGRGGGTLPAGSKLPNELGLYDMSGNVWEWCWDWHGRSYYSEPEAGDNPRGPDTKSYRVLRGGSWDFNWFNLRSSNRYFIYPRDRYVYFGFRLSQGY